MAPAVRLDAVDDLVGERVLGPEVPDAPPSSQPENSSVPLAWIEPDGVSLRIVHSSMYQQPVRFPVTVYVATEAASSVQTPRGVGREQAVDLGP